jgi:hypothetical protein
MMTRAPFGDVFRLFDACLDEIESLLDQEVRP